MNIRLTDEALEEILSQQILDASDEHCGGLRDPYELYVTPMLTALRKGCIRISGGTIQHRAMPTDARGPMLAITPLTPYKGQIVLRGE